MDGTATPGNPEVVLAENLATNPSFEIPGSVLTVRRNLIRYDTSATTGWTATSGVATVESNRLKLTQNTVNPARLGATTTLAASKAAGAYVMSYRAQTSEATQITGFRVYLYDSATSTIRASQNIPLVAGGGDNRYDFTLTATGVFNTVYVEAYGTTISAGVIVYFSEPILEAGTLRGPYFNGSQMTKTRQNFLLNPRMLTASGWTTAVNTTATATPDGLQIDATALIGSGTALLYNNTQIPVAQTDVVTGRFTEISVPVGFPAVTLRAVQRIYGTTQVDGTGATVTIQPGTTAVITTGTATPNSTSLNSRIILMPNGTNSFPSGARIIVRNAIVEKSATLGAYFDGTGSTLPQGYVGVWEGAVDNSPSYMYDGDYSVAWDGTTGAAESVFTALNAATPIAGMGWSGDGTDMAIQSSHWVRSGQRSARLISLSGASNSYRYINVGSLPLGSYTLIIPVRLAAAQTAPSAISRTVEYRVDGVTMATTSPFPNAPGQYEMRLNFTKSVMGGVQLIMINVRVPRNDADMWLDDFTLVRAPYGGGPFTGSYQDADGVEYRWTGSSEASTSQMVLPATPESRPYYCNITWHSDKDEECFANLHYALEEDVAYESQFIPEEAPWFSTASGYGYPSSPSRKFLGAYALSVSALSDSTREVGITEGILSGGVLGRERLSVPRFRFRVMLTAVDEEGLEYGKTWLSKALSEQACSTHGPSCGSSDLTFFAACPPARDFNGPMGAYTEKIDSLSRMYHDVKCIEGPIVTDTFNRAENSWGAIVEFTLAAGVPNMFGIVSDFQPISQDGETIIQDIPFNYIPYPSAELALLTSNSTNRCLAVDATGWNNTIAAVSGANPAAYWTVGRNTSSPAPASGCIASYRGLITGVKTGSNLDGIARAVLYHEIDMTSYPTDEIVDFVSYARFGNYTGELSDAHEMTGTAQWYTAANVAVGSAIPMGTVTSGTMTSWVNFKGTSLKPATATKVRISVAYQFLWNTGPTGTPSTIPVFMTGADAETGYVQTGMNYSTNPSLETNATGWTNTSTALSGSNPAGFTTAGRVTGELAQVGTASYRVRLLGNGTAASGRAQLQGFQVVDLATAPAGAAFSATVWGALSVAAGAGVTNLVSLDARLDWQTSAGAFISSVSLGTTSTPADYAGIVFVARSLIPPATATRCQLIVRAVLDWTSGATNTDARLYVDALAVTVP